MSSEVNIVVAGSADDWRARLARNCRSAKKVWLVLYHHDSGAERPDRIFERAIARAGHVS